MQIKAINNDTQVIQTINSMKQIQYIYKNIIYWQIKNTLKYILSVSFWILFSQKQGEAQDAEQCLKPTFLPQTRSIVQNWSNNAFHNLLFFHCQDIFALDSCFHVQKHSFRECCLDKVECLYHWGNLRAQVLDYERIRFLARTHPHIDRW